MKTGRVVPLAFSSPPASAISESPRSLCGIVADAFGDGNRRGFGVGDDRFREPNSMGRRSGFGRLLPDDGRPRLDPLRPVASDRFADFKAVAVPNVSRRRGPVDRPRSAAVVLGGARDFPLATTTHDRNILPLT